MHIDMLHKLRGRGAKVWVIVESTQNLEVVLGLEKSDDPRGVLRTPCLTPVTYICDWAWDHSSKIPLKNNKNPVFNVLLLKNKKRVKNVRYF